MTERAAWELDAELDVARKVPKVICELCKKAPEDRS